MAVTIRKIAEKAGVSRGTVDKVLNNRYGVSDEVREQIQRIASELGYKPNLAGKALAYQKKRIKIGIIIVDKNDQVFQDIYKGARQAYLELRDFGLSVDFCLMDTDSVEEQVHCIDKFSESGISALVITPLNDTAIKNSLKRLNEAGIKIVTINTDIMDIDRLCFIGQDLEKSGRIAGFLMGKLLPDGGEVAVITGEDKYKALNERIVGFTDIIKEEYSNIKIVETVRNISNAMEAYEKTVKLFENYRNLKGVYITTAKHMAAIGKAIRSKKRYDLEYICNDTVPEIVHLINEKIVSFTITQDPFNQGYLPLKILFDYFFQNKMPELEHIYTNLEIVTKENLHH
ncbi:MAG TPA: LacI family transcriptional regulator [Ruminiclostridium sp.]|nr:LacI family transcriptional regulator [Ruminiclostridium sp.]